MVVLVLAIEEDTFYDIDGYEVSRTNLVQQMIDYYQAKLQAGETRVTDFNEGSEIRNLLESVAVDVYALMEYLNEVTMIAFVETATGEWLDKHGANPFVQLARDPGDYAVGYVTFTIPSVQASDVTIPAGTVVASTENSLQYVTDSDLIISVGDTSVTGTITCLTVGVDGNCGAGTVTVLDDDTLIINGLTVTNSEALSGGVDYEDDDFYRQRLLDFIRKDDFGSLSYYEKLCTDVSGVHDVAFISSTGYTRKVLVNGDVKPTPDTVLADVLEVLSIPDNIVLGHSFTVDKPGYDDVDLVVNLTVSEEIDETEITNAVNAVFNGDNLIDGLVIDESLTKDMLYGQLGLIDEIESIQVLYDGSEISTITPSSNSVLVLDDLTINQSVTE